MQPPTPSRRRVLTGFLAGLFGWLSSEQAVARPVPASPPPGPSVIPVAFTASNLPFGLDINSSSGVVLGTIVSGRIV